MLSKKETKTIKHRIKRAAFPTEEAVIDTLWSENCSFKSSMKWFDLFNTEGPRMVLGAGEGLIDVGDGFVIKMSIESSNHNSSVDPYNGAATGVGGIIRDILSHGFEPIALLDCLRFGNPTIPQQRELLDKVISGKTSYGNYVGIPNLGSNIAFSDEFDDKPLVNIICVGVAKMNDIIPSIASNPDDLLVLYGAMTGLDGIAVTSTSKDKRQKKSNIQKGDPSTKKQLIDATLKLRDLGLLNGLHDLGKGGLSCAALKMAGRGKNGLTIDLLKVPTRTPNMTGGEILTSETQERMLGIVNPDQIKEVLEVLSNYNFQTSVIGSVNEGNTFFAHKNESLEANLPVDFVINGYPEQKRKVLRDRSKINYSKRITRSQDHPLIELLTNYNLSSRKSLYKQQGKKAKSIVITGQDGGVMRLPNNKLLTIATGGNSYMISQDIKDGAALATLGVIRSVISRGAVPIGMVDSLNAGNPEKAGSYTEFVNIIKGIAEVSHKMKIPVIGGNVSLNNESAKDKDRFLTSAFVGIVGLIDKKNDLIADTLRDEQGKIYLIGPDDGFLAGSEYYRRYGGDGGELTVDYEAELQAMELLGRLKPFISAGIAVGRGGLLTTLAIWSITSNIGLNYFYESEDLSFSWGEHGPRYLIQIPKDKEIQCLMECEKFETELEITPIAQIIKEKKLELSDGNSWELKKLKKLWEEPLEKAFKL